MPDPLIEWLKADPRRLTERAICDHFGMTPLEFWSSKHWWALGAACLGDSPLLIETRTASCAQCGSPKDAEGRCPLPPGGPHDSGPDLCRNGGQVVSDHDTGQIDWYAWREVADG